MELYQAHLEEDGLIELVDAELNNVCLTCGKQMTLEMTSTGAELLVCSRCGGMQAYE